MRIARIFALCLVGLLAPAAGAEEAPTTSRPTENATEVSASKRALIVELVEISLGPQAGAPMVRRFLSELQPHYPALVAEVMASETALEPAEREALAEQLSDFDAFAALFVRRFPREIDLDAVVIEAYVPLYDRHFEEAELEAIVAFYRSPAGRKMARVVPLLVQDGLTRTRDLIEPQLMRVVGKVFAERRQALFEGSDVR